jgi:hypothetical protein
MKVLRVRRPYSLAPARDSRLRQRPSDRVDALPTGARPPLPGHRPGSPPAQPDTAAPRHSTPPTCAECHGSGGTTVNHQAEPRHATAEAETSRIRRNTHSTKCARRVSNPQPAGYSRGSRGVPPRPRLVLRSGFGDGPERRGSGRNCGQTVVNERGDRSVRSLGQPAGARPNEPQRGSRSDPAIKIRLVALAAASRRGQDDTSRRRCGPALGAAAPPTASQALGLGVGLAGEALVIDERASSTHEPRNTGADDDADRQKDQKLHGRASLGAP